MRIAVVGTGGREHALASTLGLEHDVVVVPGNPGMASEFEVYEGPSERLDADLFIIGPEAPLVDGLADRLRSTGRSVFGPSRDGAMLEGSKAFMKQILRDSGVPTASFRVVHSFDEGRAYLQTLEPPYVIKTDGLAAGKGVLVTWERDEAEADLALKLSGSSFGDAGRTVVIEEGMVGAEISLLALCDGRRVVPLPAATDFKRANDGDLGPNTGGMGAHSPVPWADDAVVGAIVERSIQPVVDELHRRGIEYRGVLYAGMMLTESGPRVIEYNVRFGDPEAEVVIPRVGKGLGQLLLEAAEGHLESVVEVDPAAYLTVILASEGYPISPRVGDVITGVERASTAAGVSVFHCGTAIGSDGSLVTAGGRVLAVTARGDDLKIARERAYSAVTDISFDGMVYRSDIGSAALGF